MYRYQYRYFSGEYRTRFFIVKIFQNNLINAVMKCIDRPEKIDVAQRIENDVD